ncbi:MAG: hypothetical protein AUI47_02280 [Acidobacteria bacterium 13_1_40CM_2_68_5]|nr:MAG: hypothetical protein AUI47_02280 [Acidobacteria bacterium 13_1_40CM_2_68_5]
MTAILDTTLHGRGDPRGEEHEMGTYHWATRTVLGLIVWAGSVGGQAEAQLLPVTLTVSGTPPTATLTTNATSPVTVSLSPTDWLPSPGNRVTITVNGAGLSPTIELVCPQDNTFASTACPNTLTAQYNPIAAKQLRTSAYQGVCTNFGSPTDFSVDFTLSAATATTRVLNSLDCGGMAVIRVTNTGSSLEPFFFLLPKDSDFDGMPDAWEALYCSTGNTCLDPKEDLDSGPGALVGDGIAAFDEYRGFKVSGTYIRTNPRQKLGTTEKQKDLFLHLVNPAESGATSKLTTTAGILVAFTPLASTDGAADIFLNIKSLIAAGQLHLLCFTPGGTNTGACDEWMDRFSNLTILSPPPGSPVGTPGTPQFTYTSGGITTTTAPLDDRQININAVYPLAVYPLGIRKGLRISESVDVSGALPLGECGVGPATGSDECIIYTQRIINDTDSKIAAGATAPIKYLTFEGGKWVTKYAGTGAPTDPEKNFLRARHIEFILGMEAGHGLQLTPVFDTTYGVHNPEDAGDNMDVRIMRVLQGGSNKFYIPKAYNTTNQSCFKLFTIGTTCP